MKLRSCVMVLALVLLSLGAEAPRTPKPKLDQAVLDKLGWHLASQAYTFRKMTLLETLDTLNALGVRYVEFYSNQPLSPENSEKFNHNSPPEMIEQFLAKCKETNITPVGYGVVRLSDDEAETRKVFEFARKLKLQTLIAEPRPEAMDLIDKLANEYQINVAIHNHPKPSLYWHPEAVLEAVEGRSQRLGACADVGHWARSGLVPAECLKKLEGRIISFHLKDIDATTKRDVVWGTGMCDFPAILAETRRQGIHPVMSIEYESGEGAELVANVAQCIEYLSQQASELAKGSQ